MTNEYRYAELEKGHIRVLSIQPDVNHGPLQGNLQHLPLKDAEDAFVAVSWTWGKEPKSEDLKQIRINGRLLSIRPNLWEMLNVFRKNNTSLSLWIDAICINQDKSNPKEMNSQVTMMADIFHAASDVYVWLGPSANDSDHIMETIRSNTEAAFTTPRFLTGLIEILRRPWWTRTWIAQEYVLNSRSPVLLCGEDPGVSAELLLNIWTRESTRIAVSNMASMWSSLQTLGTVYRLHYLRTSRYTPNSVHLEPNLRNALLWLKGFEASEPRDKIYGGLGLIDAKYREQFVKKVGIHTKEKAANVYWDAILYLLECEKNSTVFYDFPVGRLKDRDVPSWVPDFNLDVLTATDTIIRLGDVTSDHLDIPREDITISEDHHTILVRGQVLDRVAKKIVVGNEAIPGWDSRNEIGIHLRIPYLLHMIRDLIHENRGALSLTQSLPEPLWKTLVAGCFGSIDNEHLKDEIGCQQRFDELMNIPLVAPPGSQGGAPLADYMGYGNKVLPLINQSPRLHTFIKRTLATGRTFFTGDKGYYGLSEAGTQERDLIVLLFPDHFIPFILRERGKAYEMVGVAYLPGPMRDAAIAEIQSDGNKLEKFTIV